MNPGFGALLKKIHNKVKVKRKTIEAYYGPKHAGIMSDTMSDVTEWVYSDNIKAIHTGNDHESSHDAGF
jgi:hypothetical protein